MLSPYYIRNGAFFRQAGAIECTYYVYDYVATNAYCLMVNFSISTYFVCLCTEYESVSN